MEKVYLEGIGCERRLMDLSKLKKYFLANGYELTTKAEHADHLVLVTCAFKKEEEMESLSRLEALSKHGIDLLVYGCLPSISPSKLLINNNIRYLSTKDVEKIDELFDHITVRYADLPDPLSLNGKPWKESVKQGVKNLVSDMELSKKFLVKVQGSFENRLRNWKGKTCNLFICRGCLGNCSYCAIRFAVGSCKSKTVDRILEEFTEATRAGYTRFRVMGDDVGAYGLDMRSSFGELMKRISAEAMRSQNGRGFSFSIEGIHPHWAIKYKDELESLLATGIVKELMCPVQSGNDNILELMRRHHTSGEIKEVLRRFSRIAPGLKLTTQIIVGFPFETRDAFLDTLAFLEDVPFRSVTVFPYDDKENTEAQKMSEKVSEEEIEYRLRKAISYLSKKNIHVYLSCPHNW